MFYHDGATQGWISAAAAVPQALTGLRIASSLRLFADYEARTRIAEATLRAQNRSRADKAIMPEHVTDALLDRWEIPDRTEAHAVEHVIG